MSTLKPKRTKPKPTPTLADQLRQAITESGLTPYRVAKNAGVTPQVVTRFINGERDLYLETAGKIAHALGLKLTDDGSNSGST